MYNLCALEYAEDTELQNEVRAWLGGALLHDVPIASGRLTDEPSLTVLITPRGTEIIVASYVTIWCERRGEGTEALEAIG